MIKLNLFRLGNLVIMRVLEQDEKYRCTYDDYVEITIYTSSNNFKLLSCECPELDGNSIWLRGADNNSDNIYVAYDCGTENEAIKYVEEVNQLVKEFNESNTDKIIIDSSVEGVL